MGDCFALLGLARQFGIDNADLESRYLSACRSIHPDHLHGDENAFLGAAEAAMASVNMAYNVLRDPVSRAEHILVLSGGPTASEHRAVPASFLETMLDLREGLADAASPSQLSRSKESVRKELTRAIGKLPEVFAGPLIGAPARQHARELLNEIAFLQATERDLLGRNS